jgi:exonuclease SbcD
MLHSEDRKEEHEKFLSWLLEIIKAESIDVLIVSGDIFDVYAPSTAAQKLYYNFLAGTIKLENAPEVFIIAGNHDSRHFLGAPSGILSKLKIHVVSGIDMEKPENSIFEIKDKNAETALVICAIPFLREKDLKVTGGEIPISEQYNKAAAEFYHKVYDKAKRAGAPVLMTGHFYVEGSQKSDDYSERTREVGSLQSLPASTLPDADYYALGHLHRNQTINGNMRYSGSPLPMSFSEAESVKYVIIAVFDKEAAETKPVIQLKEIPVWQKLRRIKGSPDKIIAEIESIKTTGENVWLEIQVTEYEGSLFNFWNTIEPQPGAAELPLEPLYKILVKQDMRVRQDDDDWRGSDESGNLAALEPANVFEKFLREENVNPEEIEVFMNMFNELYNNVIVNENGAEEA